MPLERNLAPGTIINLTVQLKTIIGEAIADGIITASPFLGYAGSTRRFLRTPCRIPERNSSARSPCQERTEDMYECGESDHMVAVALVGVTPEGYRPLKAVQDQLRAEIVKDKKAEKIMADMKAANATSLDTRLFRW